jgi:hypothetical protein
MITIRLDFSTRLFTVCGDGEPVASFMTYAAAAALWSDCREGA